MGFGPFLKAYELQEKKPWGFGTEALGFWGRCLGILGPVEYDHLREA